MKQIHIYFIVEQGRLHFYLNRTVSKYGHICLPFQHLHNLIIVFRPMGKCTVRTVFYLFSILFDIAGIPRAVFPQIHRTVTKQAVKVCQALMTGKILTRSVLKKTV